MLDQMLFKAQFTTGQTIRLNTADGVLLDSCDANIGVLQGKVRTVPAILCDGATADDQWKILNIVNGSGMFLDHVAIKGAVSDEQAHRLCQKYLTEARKGVVKNQIPVTDNGLKTFLDSATLPHKTAYFLGADAMLLDAQGTVSPVIWDENDQLVSHGGRLSQVMFDMAGCDIQGTLLEQVSPRDIIAMLVDEDSEGVMLDAMIIKYNKLEMVTQKLAEALKATDTEEFFVKTVTPIEPFKRQGVVNVGAIFEMSDSQTITVLFNNPDTTPGKLTGTDVLTSWKWILNKRDVTAILQPRAVDARKYPQIAARMFKVLAKNHDRFKRAQALKNKDELLLNELVAQVEAAQLELRTLQQQGIEIQQQIDGAMIRKQEETEALAMQQKDAVDPVSLEDEAKAGADKFHEGLKAALDQNQEAKTAVIAKLNEIVMRLINEHGFSKPEGSTQAEWHVELESDNGYDLEIATDEDEENPEIELTSLRLIVDTIDTTESVDYIVKAIAQRAFERDFDFSVEGEIEDENSPYLGKTGDYAFTVEQLKKAAVACGLDIVFADFNQTEATAGLFDSIDHQGQLIYGITAQIGKDGNVLARASVDFDGNLDLLKGNSGSESIAAFTTDQATQVNIAEILQKLVAEAAQVPELTGDEFGEFNLPEDKKELRAVVKTALSEMIGNAYPCPALNADVEIRKNGVKKILSLSSDARKLQALAALKDLLANAELAESMPSYDAGESNIKAYHILTAPLVLKEEKVEVRFVIREDDKGHYHYDHTISPNMFKNAKSPLLDGLHAVTLLTAGAIQDKLDPLTHIGSYRLNDSIETDQNNVNAMLDSVGTDGEVLNMFIKVLENEQSEQNVQMNNKQAELKKSVYAIKAANPRARKAAGTVTIQPVEGGLYEVLINLDGVGGQYAGDLEGTKAWLTHRMMGMGEAMGDKSYTFADMAVKLSLVIGADVLGIVASDNPYENAGAIDLVKALIAELHANGWEKAGSTAVIEVQVKGQSDRLKLQFDPFRKSGEIALNNTADEDIQTFTLPEASEQGIKTKAKEIMLFVQGYATAAPVDEITDATQAGDYAKIMNDEEQLKEWQDPLDSFFQSRLIDTRNALRDLGWTGERFKDLSKNGYTLKMDLMQVGGGGNVVGVTYSILDTEFRLRDDLSLAAQGLAGRIDSAVPAQTENEQNVQMNNEAPAGIVLKKEAEDAYRMLDHIILDFQGHTPSEFKNADVPGKFKPWIEKAEAVLQRKFRDEKYRAEIEDSIKRANETIDRWNRVNVAEQPTEANQDQQFLNDVIAGNVDLLSEDTANRIEQIGENLEPAHEALFEQAIEAYSQAALKNAQTIA